jgi:DnaK suppressor protein
MFVSILQRFGFMKSGQAVQPLQSRADQNTRPGTPSGDGGGVYPEAASQRRQAVKAKPAKSAKANKIAPKPTLTVKKAGKASVGKPVVKTAAKAAAKPKSVSKAVVKSVPKSSPKLAPKSKPVVKKSAPQPALKSMPVKAKLADQKTTAKKPVAKALTQPVAPKPLVKTKAVAKPGIGPVVTPVAKSAPKASLKPAPKIPQPQAVSAKAKPAVAIAPVPMAAPKPVVGNNGLPPPPPLKPGRRSSSRALAHMPPPAPMVPTHAPDAAKASYSTMTERVIAPPPHVAAKKDPKLANNWKTKTAQTLTDEEVKAMPDSEYMNEVQMAFFRHKLSILKQDIHNSAGATTEHLREDTVVVPDPADRATIEEEHALELRTRDRERKLLKKIEQSIARIDSGDYGYCDETGEPIGVGRLIARPTASLSLEAQQRRELKQKMFGD